MKKIKILPIVTLCLLLFSYSGKAQSKESKSSTSTNKIEVIDFHSTHRCMTCNAIESNTKYTLDTYFANELKSGKITFQSINVDEEKNYKMAEKFEAAGTSLFLNIVINNKETIINLTDFAFSKGRDKEVFSGLLKAKIDKLLKKL